MIEITEIEVWNKLFEDSKNDTIAIFKHSLTCSISAAAYTHVDAVEKNKIFKHKIFLVIVPKSREISNKIAEDLSVEHQSPQLLIIENGKVKAKTSHFDISETWINQNI